MKIIQVVHRYYPAVGGAENQVKSISEELVRRGHKVSVITTNSLSVLDIPSLLHLFQRKKVNLQKNEEIEGVDVHRYDALFRFYGFLVTIPMRKLLTTKADIIHAYGFYITTSLVAMMAAKHRSLPFLLTANDATVSLYGSAVKRACSNIYNYTIGKLLILNSSRVIAVSRTNAEDLVNLGVAEQKITVIPNGVKLERFFDGTSMGIEKNGPVVLYVGRISEDKGIQCLMRAAPSVLKSFPHTKFLIVGEDYGYLGKLRALVSNLGMEKSVIFTGHLTGRQLVSVYRSADVFVLPSELEAFGIVVIEAMASGVPVIVSNCGGMKDIVRDGTNGFLFDVGDAMQLAEKIKLLLSNEEFRTKFVENGKKTVRERYTIEKVVDALEKLYEKTLNSASLERNS